MQEFFEQFIHYLCSRCVINIPHHSIQNKTGGRHSHNGEILDLLKPLPPTSDRILAAYHQWCGIRPPRNIQRELATAYNSAHRTVPKTAQERAVRIILKHINDVWIQHGPESQIHIQPRAPYPDPQSRIPVGAAVLQNPEHNWFAVDLASTPFDPFDQHPVESTSGVPWSYTVGLLPYTVFQQRNGELCHPPDRDHLYARVTIPAKHWVFILREADQYTLDPQAVAATQASIQNSGVPYLPWHTYQLLMQLYRHLKQYSTVRYSGL